MTAGWKYMGFPGHSYPLSSVDAEGIPGMRADRAGVQRSRTLNSTATSRHPYHPP